MEQIHTWDFVSKCGTKEGKCNAVLYKWRYPVTMDQSHGHLLYISHVREEILKNVLLLPSVR